MKKKKAVVIAAVVCVGLLLAAGVWYLLAKHAEDTSADAQRTSIRVVIDDNYPPYSYRNSEGRLQGILIDQWELWSAKTGVDAEVTGMDWTNALEAMQNGQYDVIDTAFYSEERDAWLDYTEPYEKIKVSIFHSNEIGGITDAASLRGFSVAVKAGDSCIPILKKSGIGHVDEYSSYEAITDAAKNGKIRVFVMDEPPAHYYLNKKDIADRFSASETLYTGEFHRAVRQGDTATLQLVERGFSEISTSEQTKIHEKWFGKASTQLYLSYFVTYLLIGGLAVGLVVCVIAVWNHRLRNEVRKKTEELEREKELLTITLQSIGDGVVATDVKGVISLINPTARRLSGWGDDAVGKPFSSVLCLVNEETLEPVRSPVEKVLETGEIIGLANHTALIGRQGDQVSIADGAAPICDAEGNLYGVVMVFRDISKEKEQRERINFIIAHDSMTGLYNRWYMEEALKHYEQEPGATCALIMGDLNGLKLVNDAFGHSEGDAFIQKVAAILLRSCRPNDVVCRWGGDEFLILMPGAAAGEAERVIDRILARCVEESSDRLHLSIALGYAMKTGEKDDIQKMLREAEQWTYRRKLMIEKSFRSSVINALLSTLAAKSEETEEHAERLQQYCGKIGRILGVSAKELDEMSLFAMLHDIGKVGINDAILQKPGALTPEEWLEMRKHPEIGFRIAQNNIDLAPISEYILSHHERWDGKGYPRGLAGRDIPLSSRILAVVDAYDAMTSERVYSKARSKEEAAAEILRNAGTQFDPTIARVFVEKVLGFSAK
ncbi:MAG: transporter substrate-binding domain-containing protein [Eubacteriales bacterium]|nr:transporter substrate-binding domain-containing protein [Eubacteriales bacterium]